MTCPFMNSDSTTTFFWCFGVKIFLLVWIIAVPVVITTRLEKIIRLLQEKK